MPVASGQHDWAKAYAKLIEGGSYHCLICDAKSQCLRNFASHLNTHSDAVKEEALKKHEESKPKKKIQTLIDALPARFNKEELEAMASAVNLEPLSRIDCVAFRMAYKPVTSNRHQLRANTIKLAARLVDEQSKKCRMKAITLAADLGTVHHGYLALLACSPEVPPFLVSVVKKSALVGGRATATSICEEITKVAKKLEEHAVVVGSFVADNASNMQSAKSAPPHLLRLRCAAHVIQLMARHYITVDQPVSRAVAEATLLAQNEKQLKIPMPCATRWNTDYDTLLFCSKLNGALTDEQIECFSSAVTRLRHFYDATNYVQGDSATVWGALKWYVKLYNVRFDAAHTTRPAIGKAIDHYVHYALTLPIMTMLYLCPNIPFGLFPERFVELLAIRKVWAGWEPITEVACGKPVGGGDHLLNQANEYRNRRAEFHFVINSTATFKAFWKDVGNAHFPRLAAFALILVDATPSEASVERLFSKMKRQITSLRTRLKDEIVLAQLQIATLHRPAGVVHVDAAPFDDSVDVGQLEAFLQFASPRDLKHFPTPAGKRLRDSDYCAVCELVWDEHEGDVQVDCSTCKLWFAKECVFAHESDFQAALKDKAWLCPSCAQLEGSEDEEQE